MKLSARPPRPAPLAILVICVLAFLPTAAVAAQEMIDLGGVVRDSRGLAVPSATVTAGSLEPVQTDAEGRFRIAVPAGRLELRVTHPGHPALSVSIDVAPGMIPLVLTFEQLLRLHETVAVTGIRADANAPISKRDLSREEIDRLSYGQDVPQLLQYTPSITWYSDSGVGSNYSYFSVRGVQQSRINITYDGAPLNDPAEHALYFNNFQDFIREVDSVQIQRGVGTSTVGAPAFGGSVNFASRPLEPRPGLDGTLTLGAYDTTRGSFGAHSGLFGGGFWLSGRFSAADTDGYREHSGNRHTTFFLNGGWQDARSALRLTGFSATERGQLAFLAVEPQVLALNHRFNPLDDEETERFGQDFAQLKYTREVAEDSLVTASVYYNGADGWFRLWDDPVAQTDLLQFGVDQGFWGTMLTASRNGARFSTTLGLHYDDFAGDHTLDTAGSRLYTNTGFKNTASAFGKVEYRADDWILFGDLHLRWAKFRYEGELDLGSVDWAFLDPKVGFRYLLSRQASLYASVGSAQREPSRLDMLVGEDNATAPHDLSAVRPESVLDIEAGFRLQTQDLVLQADVYAMEFRNEIALTGELSEVGLPLRTNVDDSYRRGIEIDLRWQFAPRWSLLHSLNLSRNRISSWTQYYDVYDSSGAWVDSEPVTYRNVRPLLSPETVANVGVEWSSGDSALAITGRYVGEAQLDNTGLSEFRLPSYENVDVRASFGLRRWWPVGAPRVSLFVNNLFDNDEQFPSGYSYQFINLDADGNPSLAGSSYYYPLATRHVVVTVDFSL